jgi:putative ABC transport system permease protein
MNLYRLALRNLADNAFRSWVVVICAFLVASFVLATILILRGAEDSLRLAIDRVGADVIVVPEGAQTKVESALLMGHSEEVWMPADTLEKVAAVEGVEAVSPQIYLSTLKDASCCSVSDMFLIAYDPQTDFTLRPWLEKNVGDELKLGEAIGGTYVFVPEGEQNILLYGYFITLKGNMEPTGTGLDQSMFLTYETAEDIARLSVNLAEKPLVLPEDSISTVLVKTAPGYDPYDVALNIMHDVPGVTPIESPGMFQSYRKQMSNLLRVVLVVIAITLGLALLLIGLIFSMAANERRREMGVLRAMGATRSFVFQSLLVEAGFLALAGGLAGIAFTVLATYLFRHALMTSMGLPFLLPSPQILMVQVAGGLALALGSVTVAALIPAYRISHQDPASAMRE